MSVLYYFFNNTTIALRYKLLGKQTSPTWTCKAELFSRLGHVEGRNGVAPKVPSGVWCVSLLVSCCYLISQAG